MITRYIVLPAKDPSREAASLHYIRTLGARGLALRAARELGGASVFFSVLSGFFPARMVVMAAVVSGAGVALWAGVATLAFWPLITASHSGDSAPTEQKSPS